MARPHTPTGPHARPHTPTGPHGRLPHSQENQKPRWSPSGSSIIVFLVETVRTYVRSYVAARDHPDPRTVPQPVPSLVAEPSLSA
jgi:hypothetical protein